LNIKYRNFLTITPIFFIIVLAISLLNFNNDKNEIMSQIDEETQAIAVGSSIFIENIIANSTIVEKSDKILMHLNRIKKYNQANEFYIIDNSNMVLLTTEKNSTKKSIKKELIKPKEKNIFLNEIYTENNNSFMDATTNIKQDNKIVASLTVKVNANHIVKYLNDSFSTLIITIIIVTIIGIILSIIISNIVIKRIKILKNIANSIADGNYDDRVNALDIKEFKDLEDTLNTMKSIMKEILFKAKNSIIEQKQFSSNDDLGDIYSNLALKSKINFSNNIEFGIKKIGNIAVESLFNTVSNKDTIFSFIGEVEPQNNSIDSAIKANTANYYLSKRLLYSSELDFLSEFKNSFVIKELLIIEIDKKTLNFKKHKITNNSINRSHMNIDKNKILYFHTLDNEISKELDTYIQNYNFLNIKEIGNDLDILFKNRHNGLLLLIKNKNK
jgi:HAMP domain-containing protein